MAELAPSLVELARRYGVATEYLDWKGQHVVVPETTLVAVLGALGVAATTEDDRVAALAAHDRDYWERCLPPTIVGRSGSASSFWVHVTHGDPIGLWIRLEDGSVRTGLRKLENNRAPYDLDGRWVGEATVELPGDLPLGYHALHLQVGSFDTSTPLIVSPGSLELPARLGRRRTWGLATQLYSVRSQRSWGMGDLTDLTDLAVWSGSRHGAGSSWSTRYTPPPPPRRWSHHRTCRPRAGSSIRCICGSRRYPNSPMSATAAPSARRGPRCRPAQTRWS